MTRKHVTYSTMATSVADAMKWVSEHIDLVSSEHDIKIAPESTTRTLDGTVVRTFWSVEVSGVEGDVRG